MKHMDVKLLLYLLDKVLVQVLIHLEICYLWIKKFITKIILKYKLN